MKAVKYGPALSFCSKGTPKQLLKICQKATTYIYLLPVTILYVLVLRYLTWIKKLILSLLYRRKTEAVSFSALHFMHGLEALFG